MRVKRSLRLVLDATVAQAAGGDQATHPRARASREILLAVLKICHRQVLTPTLRDEWRKHRSSFARKWQAGMYARRKVEFLETVDEPTESRVLAAAANPKDRSAMAKDLHLVQAALATDRRIVSHDERVRQAFGCASSTLAELRAILWLNPDGPALDPLGWLEAGAPDEAELRLTPPATS